MRPEACVGDFYWYFSNERSVLNFCLDIEILFRADGDDLLMLLEERQIVRMRIIIWGAGDMGKRVVPYLGRENVIAFIDNNPGKCGTLYLGIPVISLKEYEVKYNNIPIIITPLAEEEIENILMSRGIRFYFRLSDCPSEFSNVEYTDILEKFCMNQITEGEKYVIYGSTLFAIVLNQWIKKNKGCYFTIVIPESIENIMYENMKKENPEMIFKREADDAIQENVNFLVTDEWYINALCEKGVNSERIINLYDIADREESYYNAEIEQYRNIHKGEDCFIIGHGPSLRASDLDILEMNQVITFSMNLTYKLFDKTDWRPDYYVAMDRRTIDRHPYFKWEEHTKRKCFVADVSDEFWKENRSENNIKYHSIRNMNTKEVKFSGDISRRVHYGTTVTYDCLQIAAYMGFKNIYLLGMDLAPYKQGDKSAVQYSNFFEMGGQEKKPQMWIDKILRAYLSAKKYADAHNIQIYNATRGGYLEIFDRVDFDKLF